jgi:hypothetical protein
VKEQESPNSNNVPLRLNYLLWYASDQHAKNDNEITKLDFNAVLALVQRFENGEVLTEDSKEEILEWEYLMEIEYEDQELAEFFWNTPSQLE